MNPAQYPHEAEPVNPYPLPDWIKNVRVDQELMVLEQSGRMLRAVVMEVESFAVVVVCRIDSGPAVVRGFAMNGYELGSPYPAQLKPMPEDKAESLRRRELWLELCELIAQWGEDTFPIDFLRSAIAAAKAFARFRQESKRKSIDRMKDARLRRNPAERNGLTFGPMTNVIINGVRVQTTGFQIHTTGTQLTLSSEETGEE